MEVRDGDVSTWSPLHSKCSRCASIRAHGVTEVNDGVTCIGCEEGLLQSCNNGHNCTPEGHWLVRVTMCSGEKALDEDPVPSKENS